MHAQLNAVAGVLGDAQVLDAVTELGGALHILDGDAADAFHVHLGKLQRNTEGDGGDDGELVRRVHAFHVEGRVRFRVAQALRFFQHFLEGAPALLHLGEDVVAGAVDNARHPVDVVGGQAFTQGFQNRDAAGHRRFEGYVHAVLMGGLEDFVAVLGDQRLVGGDDVLAVLDRGEHQLAGGVGAADQLHQNVDFRVRGHREDIPRHADTVDVARRIVAAGADMRDLDRAAHAPGDFPGVTLQNVDRAGAHRAQTCYADLYRIHLGILSLHSPDTPSARNIFLMPRNACRVRCSFSISAKRTWSSPYSPKPMPGDTATPAS